MIQALALPREAWRAGEKRWHMVAKARRDRSLVIIVVAMVALARRIILANGLAIAFRKRRYVAVTF